MSITPSNSSNMSANNWDVRLLATVEYFLCSILISPVLQPLPHNSTSVTLQEPFTNSTAQLSVSSVELKVFPWCRVPTWALLLDPLIYFVRFFSSMSSPRDHFTTLLCHCLILSTTLVLPVLLIFRVLDFKLSTSMLISYLSPAVTSSNCTAIHSPASHDLSSFSAIIYFSRAAAV